MIEENLIKFLENKKGTISFKFKKLKKKLNDDCYILKINKKLFLYNNKLLSYLFNHLNYHFYGN